MSLFFWALRRATVEACRAAVGAFKDVWRYEHDPEAQAAVDHIVTMYYAAHPELYGPDRKKP